MLGPCYPIAHAVVGAAARPFRHVVRHFTNHGVGRHAHHAAAHHGAVPAAVPQAGGASVACAPAPGGVLSAGPGLAGPAYGSGIGTAGNGAAPAAAGGAIGAGGPGFGGFGGGFGGLGSSAGLLASVALLAGGIGAATLAPQTDAQAPAMRVAQPAAPFIVAPAIVPDVVGMGKSPDLLSPAPGITAPNTPAPNTPAPNNPTLNNPGGSTPFADVVAVPEPASLALLGFGAAAAAWAARRRK